MPTLVLFDLCMGTTVTSAVMNASRCLSNYVFSTINVAPVLSSKLHLVHQLCVKCNLLYMVATRNFLVNWSWCSFLRDLGKAVCSLLMSDCRQEGHIFTSLVITRASSNMSAGHLHQNDVGNFLSVQSLSAPRDPTLKAMLIGLRNAEVFLCDSENLFCFLFLIILTLTGQTGWQQAGC